MTRKVLIVGFPGVQALDLVGPFDVFAGASSALSAQGKEGYQPELASLDGQPVATGTGLTFGTARLPDPPEPVDTLVLPGGQGTRPDRRDPRLIDWIRAAAPQARRIVTVCTGAFLAAQGRPARRLPGDHPLGSRRRLGAGIPDDRCRSRSDLRA